MLLDLHFFFFFYFRELKNKREGWLVKKVMCFSSPWFTRVTATFPSLVFMCLLVPGETGDGAC